MKLLNLRKRHFGDLENKNMSIRKNSVDGLKRKMDIAEKSRLVNQYTEPTQTEQNKRMGRWKV